MVEGMTSSDLAARPLRTSTANAAVLMANCLGSCKEKTGSCFPVYGIYRIATVRV